MSICAILDDFEQIGFIYQTREGEFLRLSEYFTSTGHHFDITTVKNAVLAWTNYDVLHPFAILSREQLDRTYPGWTRTKAIRISRIELQK